MPFLSISLKAFTIYTKAYRSLWCTYFKSLTGLLVFVNSQHTHTQEHVPVIMLFMVELQIYVTE